MSDEIVFEVGPIVATTVPMGPHTSLRLPPSPRAYAVRLTAEGLRVESDLSETIDGTAAEYPGTLTAEARAERAEAQLAALREACRPALRVLDKLGVDEWAAFDTVIAYTAPAAEAHDERMRAEGRDEAMADFTAARLFEAERDALAGQLAALREAVAGVRCALAGAPVSMSEIVHAEEWDALDAAYVDSGRAAEAYARRALGEASASEPADSDARVLALRERLARLHPEQAARALRVTGGDVDRAVDLLALISR